MKTVAYRSFLVRVWCRQGHAGRALVEEIQTGTRSELRGERADRLVAELDESLTAEDGAVVGPSATPPLEAEASDRATGNDNVTQEVWR